jgi:putative aldouronate transport system substrate-binding protein
MKLFKYISVILIFTLTATACLSGCGTKRTGEDSDLIGEPNFDKKIEISIGTIAQIGIEDSLYDYITDKFNVEIDYRMLDYNAWTEQVNGMINGGAMIDLLEWDLRPHLAATYQEFIVGDILKSIPSNLQYFPNLKAALDKMPVIDYLKGKNDNKLYCIPLQHGIEDTEDGMLISDMHHIYRRDWAKEANLYNEGDIYTFEEMEELMQAFKERSSNIKPFADVPWGIPSLINHSISQGGAFVKDASGKYVWKYSQSSFINALNKVRAYKAQGYYNVDFYTNTESDLFNNYKGNTIGIYYNNYTINNLYNLRKAMKTSNPSMTEEAIREATAPFYLVDADGKVANEGMDNWWSVMLFNSTMPNEKMARILAIMDWFLSEEGLKYCAYGIKGTDWTEDEEGNVTLLWEKDSNNDYIDKDIDSQNLRWIVSTCSDMNLLNPVLPQSVKDDYLAYRNRMNEFKQQNKLHFLSIDRDMQWLSSPNKDRYTGVFRTESQTAITKYINGDVNAITAFNNKYKSNIEKVLGEINSNLGLQ